jgi:hypothetical protein
MVLRRSQNRGSSVKRSKRQSDDRKTAGYCSEHYAMSLEDPDNGGQIGFEAATTPGARLKLELDQPEQRRPHLVTILRDTRPVLNGDSEPMMEVWWHGPNVTAMHSEKADLECSNGLSES